MLISPIYGNIYNNNILFGVHLLFPNTDKQNRLPKQFKYAITKIYLHELLLKINGVDILNTDSTFRFKEHSNPWDRQTLAVGYCVTGWSAHKLVAPAGAWWFKLPGFIVTQSNVPSYSMSLHLKHEQHGRCHLWSKQILSIGSI